MDHWFDDLAKGLTRETPSRRTVMRWALRASLGVTGGALLRRFGGLTEIASAGVLSPLQDGNCYFCQEGRTVILNLSSSSTFQGIPIALAQSTSKSPGGDTEINKTIRLDGKELLRFHVIGHGDDAEVRIKFGKAIKGIKLAHFSIIAKNVNGVIDKRKLLPFTAGDDLSSIKFADGKPAPEQKFPRDMPEAIKHILEKARQDIAKCAPARVQQGSSVLRRAPEETQASLVAASYVVARAALRGDSQHFIAPANSPDDHGHGSNTQTSWDCLFCEGKCVGEGVGCGAGAALGSSICIVGYLICLAAILAGCLAYEVGCIKGCHDPAGDCCPVTCGDVACCEKTEICLDPTHGICCSIGLIPCAAKSCCHPSDTCINATGECCPKERIPCHDACCRPGYVCKDGVTCCPPDGVLCAGQCCGSNGSCIHGKCCDEHHTCGKVCCDTLATCADPIKGLCCSDGLEIVCGNKCCKATDTCLNDQCCTRPCNNTCCAPDQVCCGGVCCGSGETCLDPQTRKCSGCPTGQVGCLPEVRVGNPPVPGICCPPGVVCCVDSSTGKASCCNPGDVCCKSKSDRAFGCKPSVCPPA